MPSGILASRCSLSGCHGATAPAANLDLASPDLFARLDGKMASGGPGVLIDPGGDAQASVLYLKLTPTPPFGAQMPLVGDKLDATTMACVASWITSGAKSAGAQPLDAGTPVDSPAD